MWTRLKTWKTDAPWIDKKPSSMFTETCAHMTTTVNGNVTFIYNVLDLEKDKEYAEDLTTLVLKTTVDHDAITRIS